MFQLVGTAPRYPRSVHDYDVHLRVPDRHINP